MVIQKEFEHEMDDSKETNDPMTIRALRECGILKYFRVSGMRPHVCLMDHLIRMWNPNQQHFQVGTHILTIDVKDIYLLTILSSRGSPVVVIDPRGGEILIGDLIDEYCVVGTRSQGEEIPINILQTSL